jgi:hypothetical protein
MNQIRGRNRRRPNSFPCFILQRCGRDVAIFLRQRVRLPVHHGWLRPDDRARSGWRRAAGTRRAVSVRQRMETPDGRWERRAGLHPEAATAVDWQWPARSDADAFRDHAGAGLWVHQRTKEVPRQAGAALSLSAWDPDSANDVARRRGNNFWLDGNSLATSTLRVWARRR